MDSQTHIKEETNDYLMFTVKEEPHCAMQNLDLMMDFRDDAEFNFFKDCEEKPMINCTPVQTQFNYMKTITSNYRVPTLPVVQIHNANEYFALSFQPQQPEFVYGPTPIQQHQYQQQPQQLQQQQQQQLISHHQEVNFVYQQPGAAMSVTPSTDGLLLQGREIRLENFDTAFNKMLQPNGGPMHISTIADNADDLLAEPQVNSYQHQQSVDAYLCGVCQKSFAQLQHLQVHMHLHDINTQSTDSVDSILMSVGEAGSMSPPAPIVLTSNGTRTSPINEFCCDLCGNTFREATSLSQHMASNHTIQSLDNCPTTHMPHIIQSTRSEASLLQQLTPPATPYEMRLHQFSTSSTSSTSSSMSAASSPMSTFSVPTTSPPLSTPPPPTSALLGMSHAQHTTPTSSYAALPASHSDTANSQSLPPLTSSTSSGELMSPNVIEVITSPSISHCDDQPLSVASATAAAASGSTAATNLTFLCTVCGQAYRQQRNLTAHMLVHTANQQFQCEQCPKTFNQRSSMKIHMNVHNRDKPYKCGQCDKSYTQAANLKSHMRSHSADGLPFSCETCGKTFSQLSSLKSHRQGHIGHKPHKCTVCGKAYTQSSSLKVHMNIHTGTKPYKCEVCEKSFSDPSNFRKHKATTHGI